jgi:hypothetical protein
VRHLEPLLEQFGLRPLPRSRRAEKDDHGQGRLACLPSPRVARRDAITG